MTTVTGVISLDNVQVDGRHAVLEVWTDDLGNNYTYSYLADVGTDTTAVLNSRQDEVLQTAIAYQSQQVSN